MQRINVNGALRTPGFMLSWDMCYLLFLLSPPSCNEVANMDLSLVFACEEYKQGVVILLCRSVC